ncbi:MAG: sn-glycerol-3-phosphate ABC transporter ATP-binding protein UgpC [Bacteroidota bacterium]
MARVRLDTVRKVYPNGYEAVHGASFEVRDGEFVVFVGPSGCGKSTLLRMIAGLEEITSGTLTIGDRAVNDLPPKDRDVAMVFQNYALYPHLTVYDNMAFGLKIRKFPKSEIDDRVREAARILGVDQVLDRKPKLLSGGQRQRVAVGRAIVRKPEVFLFDEPLSNLDAKLRVQMRTEISRLHSQLGATMIYVTHDQVEAMTMGDRIVVLKDGEVQQIDTPLRLYNRPANQFVAGFIGSPAMNFLSGRIEGAGDALSFVADETGLSVPLGAADAARLQSHAGTVTLGIRPEDLYAAEAPAGAASSRWTLDVVEPMGNEIVLYVHSGPHTAVARVAPQPVPEPGSEIGLALDAGKLHFFDRETERALTETEPVATA